MSELEELQERVIIDEQHGDVTLSNQDFWILYGKAEDAEKDGQEIERLENELAYEFNRWLNACVAVVGKDAAYEIIANLSEGAEEDARTG
ncbi:hypothetical protein J2S78_002088 [Salibacterium salarium]|uniref:hypothetical protein n=1 Tax=Salibacterium salarium TaxID=284579 RepID=UPI002783BDBB|nr:hypothetical protein [Salibacterium salarium]MDQ0299668.1 hypothetical protein [Salibacterium salarium]